MSLMKTIQNLRRDYTGKELSESKVNPDPMAQFENWLEEALDAELPDPHAMVLATVKADGRPSARVVLLRGVGPDGFTFYTNYDSRKAKELESRPAAALVFYWEGLDRQVRIDGYVSRISGAESDRYFATRPRLSQISAWVSPQSSALPNRGVLEEKFDEFETKYYGKTVPRPENWGGFRLTPDLMEFWQGRPNRLHDRIMYTKGEDGAWAITRLAP